MASKTLKTLYRKTANGKIYFWKANVKKNENEDEIYVIINHGLHNGKVKTSKRKILKTGRENTLFEKGVKIIEKKWKDKINKEGYVDDFNKLKNSEIFVTPMLASKVIIDNDKIKGMTFPLMVQPKLDGFRCTANFINGKVELLSRNNMPYKGFPTLKNELHKLYSTLMGKKMDNTKLYLDGELYIPDIPFENLSGLIKRAQNHCEYDIKNIEFRIFDCFNLNDMDIKFCDRISFLKSIIPIKNKNIVYVSTYTINNLIEFKQYFSLFIEDGYEGIMVRKTNSKYEISKRSSNLKKYKVFNDDEFEIVGYQEGGGTDEKTVIWKCKTNTDECFNVRPVGNLKHRKQLFIDADKYIGKKLTVKYQELSEMGVPRFPVGKDIRE